MESPLREIDPEQLVEYSKALKDFKKTGITQCIAILKDLLEVNLSINQLKESKIGPSLSKIAKEEIHDDDEKVLKDTAVQLFKKCKQRDDMKAGTPQKGEKTRKDSSDVTDENKKPNIGENLPEPTLMKKKSSTMSALENMASPSMIKKKSSTIESLPETTMIRKKSSTMENLSSPSMIRKKSSTMENLSSPSVIKRNSSTTEETRKGQQKENIEKKTEPENDSGEAFGAKDGESLAKLPLLTPEHRNFSLRSFVDGLLSDYKTNPSEKERLRPIANKKAFDIEKALNEKVKGNDQEYRMEARVLSTFLLMKNNLECRTRLMDGTAECKEFVLNKENFLNEKAKERIEEKERRVLDANNADYDKKIVRESQLYQCKKCKSKRISKTEKQTRSGDEPMTSFFNCVDCGAGWKE